MAHRRNVVMLMGPTGAGKSALALKLAHRFGGEVINADSRQIYRGMDIGTDKLGHGPGAIGQRDATARRTLWPRAQGLRPKDEPLLVEDIPHYLLDIITPDRRYSAAEFRDDATRIIADIHRRRKLPIAVGGTGFYLRVLTGDRTLPAVPPNEKFRTWAETQSVEALARELQTLAPDLHARVDNLKNRRRVTRALEIARAREEGGRRSSPTPNTLLPTPWRVLKLALLPSPEDLRQRIEARVDEQLRRGFLEEAQRLTARYGTDAPGLQAVGYRQLREHVKRQPEEIRAAIIRAHWDYARRQRGWLRREPNLVRVASADEAVRRVSDWIERKKRAEVVK